MKRALALAALLSLLIFITGCSNTPESTFDVNSIKTYTDIPGVTQGEIDAIESLKSSRERLTYGQLLSTEAFVLPDGTHAGFTADFTEFLSSLFGIEFVSEFYEWDELIHRLDKKAVDFTGELTQTPERMLFYSMTHSIAERPLRIFTRTDSNRIETEADIDGRKIGLLTGAITADYIKKSYPVSFEIVSVDNYHEAAELLKSGEIDAFVEEAVADPAFEDYDFIRSREFFPMVYMSVSMTTANPELAPIVSVLNKYLVLGGTDTLYGLYKKGDEEYAKYKLDRSFTDEERAYLDKLESQNTPIRVALEADNYPISFYNQSEGEFQGVAPDVIAEISKLIDVDFKTVTKPGDSWSDILEMLRAGKASMVSQLLYTNSMMNSFLLGSTPYSRSHYALISKSDFPNLAVYQVIRTRVGNLNRTAYEDLYKELFSDSSNSTSYETQAQALRALENGEIDLLMASENLLLAQTNYHEKPGYKANIVLSVPMESVFGFNRNEKILCSIIDKAQLYVNTNVITKRWTSRTFDYSKQAAQERLSYLMIFAAILIFVLIFTVAMLFKNKLLSKNLEKLVRERTAKLEQQTAALEKRLNQQALMAGLSQNFISGDDVGGMISRALQMTGEFMDISRIMLASYESRSLNFLYEWRNNGSETSSRLGAVFPLADTEEQIARAFVQRTITHFNLDAADGEEIIARFGLDITTALMLPVYAGDEFWGVLEFDQCNTHAPWTPSDITLGEMIAGVLSGVIARRNAEESLLRMSSIVNSSPQYIAYVNGEGNFDFFSPATYDITGYSHEELITGGMRILYDDETNARIRDEILPKIFEYGKYSFEIPLLRKDGERRIMSFSAFTIESDAYACGTIATDVTEQKLLERQLVEAKELAEKNSSAKSEFLSRMSHEMRTPMNAIIGMTAIGKSADSIERKDYCLDKIDSASSHLLGVINDVLDMSKIEAGKFELSNTDFILERMLMKITNVINFRMEEKSQVFNIKVDTGVPQSIISDEQRLNQVITNLLSNAVKFTPDNGTISLFVRKAAEENGIYTLEFEVKDTGIGISEEQQKKLFTSFEQADGSISRKYGGTGLGLAISKHIVELMGGRIWIESKVTQGSSFIFQIQAGQGKSSPHVLRQDIGGGKLRVLAVDDDEDVRDYFLSLSDSLGLRCETAASGIEACGLIERRGPYRIIFVDWKMPGMDGIELTKLIKNQYSDNTIVIMISATEWSYIEADAKQAGVDRFIPKPLFASVIAECINECVGASQNGAPDGASADGGEESFKDMHILLAEDVDINREVVMALLEPTGVRISCAENGGIAYQMFKDNPDYDMIFMDIHMPEVDGYSATRLIRALDDPRAKTVPIIAMTANVFREDIERCLNAGMNAHVGKPLALDDVMSKLREYLAPGSRKRQSEQN